MKERIVTFGDAIIAIIITIMVLSLPMNFNLAGQLDYGEFFRAIGIYFISFCFVGDLWYQGAQIFSKIKKVGNFDLILYMLYLFFLSLIPIFTRLLIEDTNQEIVLMYGVLSFVVTLLWTKLLHSFKKELKLADKKLKWYRDKRYTRLLFRLLVLIFAYIFPSIGLLIYLVLPIYSFLQNIVEKEEDSYLEHMDADQKDYYLRVWNEAQKNGARKFVDLLRASLSNDSPDLPARSPWWREFNQEWSQRLDDQLTGIENRLDDVKNDDEKRQLKRERDRLLGEKKKVERIVHIIKDK